jgi:hypothetical protein
MPESSNSSTQGSSQPLAARGRPINDLPSELLGYIFEIGTREDEDPDSDMLSDGWETEEEGENALKNAGEDTLMVDADIQEKTLGEEPRRPFQVTVSHVCHLWRGEHSSLDLYAPAYELVRGCTIDARFMDTNQPAAAIRS